MTTIEPARRAEVLEHRRTTKMASSAHAYVRGNTILFYEWLAGLDASRLPSGPAIWICGDCHVGNLGPLADGDGHVDVQIRDLDQTVIGNPAHALSPNLGERMMAADLLGRPVILRELMPQDLKLEIDQFSRAEAVQAARYLAYVVGRAHTRQLDEADRGAWCREMERQHAGDLDAPHWLWSSVVALAAEHERGYLEHCRRYALAT